jgi:type I restriction enzyme R subunit
VKFNEDSRVKIPAILHLTRLGYTYLSLKGLAWDESSNIVPSLFCQSVSAINPTATPSEIEAALARDWFLPMLMNRPVKVGTNER